MTGEGQDRRWEAGTHEGARRAMLRRALRLTVRERLEALDRLARTSERLAEAGRRAVRTARDQGGPGADG